MRACVRASDPMPGALLLSSSTGGRGQSVLFLLGTRRLPAMPCPALPCWFGGGVQGNGLTQCRVSFCVGGPWPKKKGGKTFFFCENSFKTERGPFLLF
jgi:hypothetical protein